MTPANDESQRLTSDRLIGAVIGSLALLLYVRCLCPTAYLGDSGELAAAIYGGGNPHPPGYPLFTLLGQLSLILVPVGEPAFRIGLVCAVAGGVSVGCLYRLCRSWDLGAHSSAVAAATFALLETQWVQAVRVEVYSLHVLIGVCGLWAATAYGRTGARRHLVCLVLLLAAGLSHHLTIVVLAPAVLALMQPRWASSVRERLLCFGAPLLAVPLAAALYATILVRARAEPLLAWGRPVTPDLLWNHASAKLYQGMFLRLPRPDEVPTLLGAALGQWVDELGIALSLLSIAGVLAVLRRNRLLGIALALGIAGVSFYNLCYRIEDPAPYYLPLWVLLSLALAAALDLIASGLRSLGAESAARLAWLVPIGLLLQNAGQCDLSRAVFAREFARQKLESCAPNAVLLTMGDQDTFPLWYVHDVLHVRPDVLPLDRLMVLGSWRNLDRDPSLWYLHRLRRQGVPAPLDRKSILPAAARYARDAYLISILNTSLAGRPLYATFLLTQSQTDVAPITTWMLTEWIPVPSGLVLRLLPKGTKVDVAQLARDNDDIWSRIEVPDVQVISSRQEMSPDYVRKHYDSMIDNWAGLHDQAGNPARATQIREQYLRR